MTKPQQLIVAVLALLSCACSSPALRNDAFAARNGFTRDIVPGTSFSHRVYVKAGQTSDEHVWHVYIEGDGQPWAQPQVVAKDPTPSEPLMLQLMAQDTQPAIYLGRPCYHGRLNDAACNPWVWTFGRYSSQVVESLRVALEAVADAHGMTSLVLIGHSGGGTLAMLLAERVPRVHAVVTLAGNLDVEAWAALHAYTGMEYSLNPARRPPLPARIQQLHFTGRNDSNVPTEMLEAAIKQQKNARAIVLADVQHRFGWNEHWKEVLIKISALGGGDE